MTTSSSISLNRYGRRRPSRLALRFRDVDHRQGAAVPGPAAAVDVPGDVELISLRIDGGAEGPDRRSADVVLEIGMQEGDDLPLAGPGIELDDGAAILVAAAVGARDVVQVTPGGVGVDRGDVLGG